MVKVILRQDVADLGLAGEMVSVRPGYARNYLIPEGIALAATKGNRRRFEEERRRVEQSAERAREAARELADEVEGRELSFVRRASDGGRLFGSVTQGDIADALEADGVSVERRTIRLDDPIKELGVHVVSVRIHVDVEPKLRVSVVAEE